MQNYKYLKKKKNLASTDLIWTCWTFILKNVLLDILKEFFAFEE